TGEDARAGYAETLLVAARRVGAASTPMTGVGLRLSLHHPIKERLMTLNTHDQDRRGKGRWALAATLLAGAALCAPLSFADDDNTPEVKAVTSNVMTIRVQDDSDGQMKGFEIRDENGERTYLRSSADGTQEFLTREELESEYGIEIEDFLGGDGRFPVQLDGEPGLAALLGNGHGEGLRSIIINRADASDIDSEVVDGERRFFKTDENGVRTEIELADILKSARTEGTFRFELPEGNGNMLKFFDKDGGLSSEGLEGRRFIFNMTDTASSAEARLNSAKMMLDTTNRMVEGLRADMDGSADGDLKRAERELDKALKALEKAQAAVAKSVERE
ncbi:MAG: hypothetical protein WBG08_12880, partial [Litorimonas sp.]